MLDFTNIENDSLFCIPSGIHYITNPIRITGKNIRIVGEDGAVLRGTIQLSGKDFTETEPGVYSAAVPYPADAFYIGKQKYRMARYPKYRDPDAVFGGYSADSILPEKTKEWSNPYGGYIHAMHSHLWGGYTYKITGKNPDGTLKLLGGWQNNRQMGMHNEYRFAENIREEMTDPGEWYYDETEKRIYVRPLPGDSLDRAEIAVSKGFFILENCENVSIENIVFERSIRTFMETKEPLLRSDWTIYRGGAVMIKNSSACTVDRCSFFDVGSNGVFVDQNCESVKITRSHLRGIGASGLCFVGAPDSVRNPLFEYNETQSLSEIDTAPGPKSDNYPQNCTADNCLIEYVGTTEKQAAGIEISMAYGISVTNCTICHTSRAGINISEGTFGGHRIEGCDIFDTVRETGDHGSFNSWGRDRYWHLHGLDDRDADKYALLDMISPNIITRNRFRCDRGWDIDLDDGSSNYIITENLCLSGGIKLREGFFRTVERNITVNNTLHFHVWYPKSGDVVENNIIFKPYSPIGMPEHWGRSIDKNIIHVPGLYTSLHAENLSDISAQDNNSICIDAGFIPENGYLPTNPIIQGFENFPTEFGVKYPPLRRITDTPLLPEIALSPAVDISDTSAYMYGMIVKNIETDGEMSVYGTAEHNGVLILSVDPESEAGKLGFCTGDVIIGCSEGDINQIPDLRKAFDPTASSFEVLRKQKKIIL